jgi:hypothetical protein
MADISAIGLEIHSNKAFFSIYGYKAFAYFLSLQKKKKTKYPQGLELGYGQANKIRTKMHSSILL